MVDSIEAYNAQIERMRNGEIPFDESTYRARGDALAREEINRRLASGQLKNEFHRSTWPIIKAHREQQERMYERDYARYRGRPSPTIQKRIEENRIENIIRKSGNEGKISVEEVQRSKAKERILASMQQRAAPDVHEATQQTHYTEIYNSSDKVRDRETRRMLAAQGRVLSDAEIKAIAQNQRAYQQLQRRENKYYDERNAAFAQRAQEEKEQYNERQKRRFAGDVEKQLKENGAVTFFDEGGAFSSEETKRKEAPRLPMVEALREGETKNINAFL